MKAISYKNGILVKALNKRVSVSDRKDGAGVIVQFSKMNNEAENDKLFSQSIVKGKVRYTTISLSDEALLALLAACLSTVQRRGEVDITGIN